MQDTSLLEKLERLLVHKKSKSFYAKRLGVPVDAINGLLQQIRLKSSNPNAVHQATRRLEENIKEGTGELTFTTSEQIKTLEDLIRVGEIDTEKWEIRRYVENFWGNEDNPNWQVKAWLDTKSAQKSLQDAFIEFLDSYTPQSTYIPSPRLEKDKPFGCLLLNKQDAHFNRADGVGDDNDIDKRFDEIFYRTEVIINQAKLSNNLDKILYILGSDAFNSEFNEQTTRGTPQENILDYHDAFERICDHEVNVINMMLSYGQSVEVTFIRGNHDEYAGWHMVNWLKTYFRNNKRVSFDISPIDRKYISYGESAMMFNHGDKIKPERLAAMFPIEYREKWSDHRNFYIFTGDKHIAMSADFNGIEFYRISGFSTVSSKWEDRMGYTGRRPGVTAFLIDKELGMTNIFKQYL